MVESVDNEDGTRTVTVTWEGGGATYTVGDCANCHRTSVRFYSPNLCFWCARDEGNV